MSWEAEFCENRASEEEIAKHLFLCDARFIPPLSSRIEIEGYAHKIFAKATRFEAWAEGSLIGLLAIYCNDSRSRLAYITNVSVLETPPGSRIASQLMERSIGYLRESDCGRVELEVDRENQRAIRLYERYGFVANKVNGRAIIMGLDL
jgi:ribosomal protein S18 acetylase RimI-like enzyme